MNLYLDDDVVSAVLIKLLRRTRHDVVTPADNGLSGSPDVRHLEFAIRSKQGVGADQPGGDNHHGSDRKSVAASEFAAYAG